VAIAQRQFPGVVPRAATRPAPSPQARPQTQTRARRRVKHRSLIAPIAAAIALAAALVAYIYGHAQVTDVSYQRVRLQRQMQALQAQQQQLKAESIKRRDKDAVEAWAKANGMVRPDGTQMALSQFARKGP